MSEAASRTFEGYRRADGRVGVRNHVLVLSPTGLTSAAATRVSSLVRGTICVTIMAAGRWPRTRSSSSIR
jgi:altronate dehydratase